MDLVWGALGAAGRHRGRGDGDAARAPRRPGGQLLQRRRPRLRRLRRARHRVLGPARLHHLPRLLVVRRVADGRREPRRRSWPQQVQTAQFLPADATELTGELVCYARSVAGDEWDALNAGTLGDAINPWGAEMFRTISTVDPRVGDRAVGLRPVDGPDEQPEQARIDRVHGAEGIIPHAAVGRPVRDLRGDLRLHAVLRRPGRAGGDPGGADGQRDRGDHPADAAADVLRPSARLREWAGSSRRRWSGPCA